MSNLILLALCLGLGILLRLGGRMPEGGHRSLNVFILHVSLPALVLQSVHGLALDPALLVPALMPWLVFGLGAVLFYALFRRGVITRSTLGCLVLTSALGNTSFVGLPMIEAYYGREHLGVGLIADQLGTFLCLSIPGILLAARWSARPGVNEGSMLRRVLLFPPFLSVLAAFALRGVELAPWLTALLERLGNTLTPLALVSVGLQLRLGGLRQHARGLALGLGYKLVLAPIAALMVFGFLLGTQGAILQVTVFEAAMAPMITGAIVAQEHELDAPLAALMVGVGIPLSFLTLPAWWWLLRGF